MDVEVRGGRPRRAQCAFVCLACGAPATVAATLVIPWTAASPGRQVSRAGEADPRAGIHPQCAILVLCRRIGAPHHEKCNSQTCRSFRSMDDLIHLRTMFAVSEQ